MFDRIANLTWKHPKAVLALVGLFVLAGAIFGRGVEEHLKPAGFTDPASESDRGLEMLRSELGYDPDPGILVLLRDRGGGKLEIGSQKLRREAERLAARLGEARHVGKVVNPLRRLDSAERQAERAARAARREAEAQAAAASQLPPGTTPPAVASELPQPPSTRQLARELRRQSPLIADDGRSLIILGHLTAQDIEDAGGEAADDARELLSSELVDLSLTGFAAGFSEVEDQAREDLQKAELIAFPILAILLLIVFRGVIAAALPLLIGGASILGTFLFLRLMAEFVDTSLFALNIATALSLGLAVDYALLMVTRFREELEREGPTREAHRRVLNTAGKTVMFSGLTVALALVALIVFPQRFLYSVGAAGAAVGILASIISLLALGSIFALLGERINSLAIRKGAPVSRSSGGWYRLAWGVMRRPITVAAISAGALLALTFPAVSAEFTGPSAEAVPPSQPSFEPSEYIAANYSRQVIQPVTVSVSGPASARQLRRLNREVRELDGLASGVAFDRIDRDFAYATFATSGKPLADAPQEAVREIRRLDAPGGTKLFVSGNTARFIDQKQSLLDHAPLVIAIIVVTTFILLFMLTGSIVLPIKTLIMNALTLGATLGILVLAFQDGLLHGPLDYMGPSQVEVTSVVFLFAIAFGLATDYAVLVMARIKENHDGGMANEEAVATGIGRTGRVITAAAVMIAVVFFAFAVSDIFFMKQVSIGQATAVLIDATIVRALLVPSLMRLFGDWNWWAPAPMKRFQARFGFAE